MSRYEPGEDSFSSCGCFKYAFFGLFGIAARWNRKLYAVLPVFLLVPCAIAQTGNYLLKIDPEFSVIHTSGGFGGGGMGDLVPSRNGVFDQFDIIAALCAGCFLTGPYAVTGANDVSDGVRTSLVDDNAVGRRDVASKVVVRSANNTPTVLFAERTATIGRLLRQSPDPLGVGEVARIGTSDEFATDGITDFRSSGDGDLVAIPVPEPSSLVLFAVGLSALLFRKRRSRYEGPRRRRKPALEALERRCMLSAESIPAIDLSPINRAELDETDVAPMPGDANQDFRFDQRDVAHVLQAGSLPHDFLQRWSDVSPHWREGLQGGCHGRY